MTSLDERTPDLRPYDLADRYRTGDASVVLTGVQAVARLIVEQHERDKANGLRTASLVSGYPGSPLAGVDKTLAGVKELRTEHDMHLVPGMNEELGATSVWGSQQQLPEGTPTHDGVVGYWYGKGPGVDRAGDALRHGNLYGANPRGGVVVLAGDDPGSKSSTVPCVSERSLAAMGIPVLFPRNAEEVVAFGLYAVALSRASGCWVSLKMVSDVADGLFSVNHDFAALPVVTPEVTWNGKPWTYSQRLMKSPTDSLLAEADLLGPRMAMVEAFGAANPVDEITLETPGATVGIIAPGTAYDLMVQALRDLGVTDADLERAGVRLLRIGMVWPLGPQLVQRFAEGLERILVVEEKTSFIEAQVRDLLYDVPGAPRVLGKKAGVPSEGALTADKVAPALRALLAGRVELVPEAPKPRTQLTLTPVARIPYFCSGCPHNTSTNIPEGSLAAGGIGCHTMVTIAPRASSQVVGITQMGGEGAQWIGQAPFHTGVDHIFQNVGDGTYFHSGQLAVQACIAAGVNITYKILFNEVVAMTGAQDPQAALAVPALTRKLAAEGVVRTIVVAEEPEKYAKAIAHGRPQGDGMAAGVVVWHRDRLDEAQRELRDTKGVTVLIYDQHCAADARRLRKRDKLPARPTRVLINEAVCEGCGDCGVQSNCLSVQPVDTEFGRKTRIDQTSCNTDYSCLKGDCPSFVTLTVDPKAKKNVQTPTPPAVPTPELPAVTGTWNIFSAGIGGTGIVTVNQILATAAVKNGLAVAGLDQTGLSQKAGPVTSHLRLSADSPEPANKLSSSATDCYLAFDLMVATAGSNLGFADLRRTRAAASTSKTPTGPMVFDASVRYPEDSELLVKLDASTASLVTLDALDAADALFGSQEQANLLVVGAAFQSGALPLTAEAIESAIEANGVAVKANIGAFRWGRVSVADRAAFDAAVEPREVHVPQAVSDLGRSPLAGETRRLAEIRHAGLVGFSGERLASAYLSVVERVWAAERQLGERTEVSETVAKSLHKLMAYKDEYEVARLLTDPGQEAALRAQLPAGTNLTFNLHPPTLRAAGLGSKIKLGPKLHPAMKTLAKAKALRGTPADPFGYALVRRVERALVEDYLALVDAVLRDLTPATFDAAVAVLALPETIRGYEDIKLDAVQRYALARADAGRPVSDRVTRLLASRRSSGHARH